MRGIDLRRFFASEPDDEGSRARIGTPFNYLEFPTDIVLLVVMWRLRDKLSRRDLAEMFLERGFEFTHEAVGEWEARFAPLGGSSSCVRPCARRMWTLGFLAGSGRVVTAPASGLVCLHCRRGRDAGRAPWLRRRAR